MAASATPAVSPVHRGIGREEFHSNDGELTNGCKKAWRRTEGRRQEGWPQVELAQVKRTQELAPEVVVEALIEPFARKGAGA